MFAVEFGRWRWRSRLPSDLFMCPSIYVGARNVLVPMSFLSPFAGVSANDEDDDFGSPSAKLDFSLFFALFFFNSELPFSLKSDVAGSLCSVTRARIHAKP